MAALPLNTFKTKTAILTANTSTVVYVTPVGVTAIVLMANIANVTTGTQYVSLAHYRNLPILPDSQGNGGQDPNVTTEIVKNFALPANDSANVISGKLIVEQLDRIVAYAGNPSTCKIILSILETANS
jgi:negative regulator of sigma E activity